jgi:large subunit ribosomal protein L28
VALRCFISGKKPVVLKKVSHSHVRTNKKVKPNLQTVTIMVGNNKKKVRVCTKMIKKGKTIGLRLTKQQYKQVKRSPEGLSAAVGR